MNVISNSNNVINEHNITGYIQTSPSDYNESLSGGFNIYNQGFNTSIGYGAFNLWNLTTLDCIFAWNAVANNYINKTNIGFGNGPGNKDWTFTQVAANDFIFQIYVN
jgi:hypothetical protein